MSDITWDDLFAAEKQLRELVAELKRAGKRVVWYVIDVVQFSEWLTHVAP